MLTKFQNIFKQLSELSKVSGGLIYGDVGAPVTAYIQNINQHLYVYNNKYENSIPTQISEQYQCKTCITSSSNLS